MSTNISLKIKQLIEYALDKKLISEEDRIYMTNSLMSALGVAEYIEPDEAVTIEPLEDILAALCDYAAEKGLLENVYRQ